MEIITLGWGNKPTDLAYLFFWFCFLYMQAHPFYDFEEVIDSDEELNLDAMDSGTSGLS